MKKEDLIGLVLALAVAFTVLVPVALAASPEQPQEGEEEMELGSLGPLILGLLGPLPTGKETVFPYPCLDTCLNFIVPPCEPVLTVLPFTLKDTIDLCNAVSQNPEAMSLVLRELVPVLVKEPYIIIGLLDMMLNPFSLKLCNPWYCFKDPTVRGIIEQVKWSRPCSSCLEATSQVIAMVILGLPLRALTPLIPIIPVLLTDDKI